MRVIVNHLLETDFHIPRPTEDVFAFFADAANLERITPPELRFRILTPLPIAMRTGALIEYQLQLLAIPFRWTTRITIWDPPFQFVDEQLRGPYAVWVHRHSFEADTAGTVIRDRVEYRLPLLPLGEIAYPVVRRQLERIFSYRQRAVQEALLA